MTLAPPAVATQTINGLIPKVKAFLQNRPDVSETQVNLEMRPSAWLRDSLREITANYPFTELQKAGPLATIGPGLGYLGSNYMYPVSQFLFSGDDVTLMEDPAIFLTPQQALSIGKFVGTTTGTVSYAMDYLTVKAIQPMLFVPGGIPFRYTRFGNMFWFGTQPGSNFSVYLPYQVRHPFNPSLPTSPAKIPQEWEDIISIAAAERGATVLRWNDQANYLHNLIYGDPKSQLKDGSLGNPGLIAVRIEQQQRDRRLSTVQITPMVSRY